MNRERAETYLRLLAESELRRVTVLPAAGNAAGQRHAPRLALAAQALCTAGAIDAGTAVQVMAELDLALTARQLSRPGLPPRSRLDRLTLSRMLNERDTALLTQLQRARTLSRAVPAPGSHAGHPASPAPQWRVAPVGQVIPGNGLRGGLLLLAYAQTPAGARFTVASGMAGSPRPPSRQLTATDDQGTSYQLGFIGGSNTGVLGLDPDPPRAIRWLGLITAPGEPATRIHLDPPGPHSPPPEITVTRTATSPGEILLDVIAARILASAAGFPPGTTARPPAANTDLRAFVGDGPGNVTAALYAVGALPPASPVPGQLAGLCERLGIPGHGITAPPAADLPRPWQAMLVSYHRRQPHPPLAPGSWATAIAGLPELDGVQITVLGLHQCEPDTILHMLASGVTLDDHWKYARGVRPLPALWIRDSNGHWHTTRTSGTSPWKGTSMVVLWLAIVPPLEADAAWIDVVAAAPSAKVRVRLPLRWQ